MPQAPDYLIVGAQKAGTTSLYNCINQHPSVLAASKKEIHYFSQFYSKGLPWYLNHFPERPEGILSGEASPFYLLHPQSPQRIASLYPQIKIIIVLRDPVERAISQYHQQARRGHEKLPILEAFAAEPKRIQRAWDQLLNDENISGIRVQQFTYLLRGQYLEQLQRYEALFPANQIHLIESSAFFESPHATLSQLFEFLQIDAGFEPSDLFPRKPGHYGDMEPRVLNFLKNYYRPHNHALFTHLGKEFNWLQ